jgi:hypothetical protein
LVWNYNMLLHLFRTRVEPALASIVLAVVRYLSRGRLCLSRGPSVPCMASLSSCWWSSSQFPAPSWWLFSGSGTWTKSVSHFIGIFIIACGGLRRHFRCPQKFTATKIMGAPKTWLKKWTCRNLLKRHWRMTQLWDLINNNTFSPKESLVPFRGPI